MHPTHTLANGRWELPAHARGVIVPPRTASPPPPEPHPAMLAVLAASILAIPFIARDAMRR